MPKTIQDNLIPEHEAAIIQDNLISEHEAAKIIGRAVQTLRNDRHTRKGMPYVKLGRSVRYSQRDIQEYIQSNRIIHV